MSQREEILARVSTISALPTSATQMLALANNQDDQKSLCNRRIMPVTFDVFDQCEELTDLQRRMPGYDRR